MIFFWLPHSLQNLATTIKEEFKMLLRNCKNVWKIANEKGFSCTHLINFHSIIVAFEIHILQIHIVILIHKNIEQIATDCYGIATNLKIALMVW